MLFTHVIYTCISVSHGSKLLPTKLRPRSRNLSKKNQVKSLSVTFHPTISMSLSYKSTVSPSVVSKSSSVTSVTCQTSLSSEVPSSSSWSSCDVDSSSSRLPTVTVSSLNRLSSSSYRTTSTPSVIFSDTILVGVRIFCDSRNILDYPSTPSSFPRRSDVNPRFIMGCL